MDDQAEFYLNNVRARCRMRPSRLQLLPVGTMSNEALHKELNVLFRETQQLHQSTLMLKLRCILHMKQLAHTRALSRPTVRQLTPAVLLARATLDSPWSTRTWRDWCAEQCQRDEGREKASLPLTERRAVEARTVAAAVRKRPAGVLKRPAASRKRTVFTRRRVGPLRLGGVRRSTLKGPRA